MSRLAAFRDAGQSLWLDSLSRELLRSGELARLVRAGVTGVTSNPTIFAQAFARRDDYRDDVDAHARAGLDAHGVYERLVAADVREACELLLPTWRESERWDGCVSVEVAPSLAHDAAGTLEEAERWWSAVGRPNLMIKVPATAAGLEAMTELVRRGRNVNVTLIFGLEQYRRTLDAWLEGLERRRADGAPLEGVACVASFFLSRIDTAVDARLDALAAREPGALELRGGVALALARLAWQAWRGLADEPRWVELRHAGASAQRLLFASTGTKDPRYPDLMYVEPLALAGTVNTLPRETLAIALDRGAPRPADLPDAEAARVQLARLASLGIDPQPLAEELQRQGLEKFAASFDEAVAAAAPHGASARAEARDAARPG